MANDNPFLAAPVVDQPASAQQQAPQSASTQNPFLAAPVVGAPSNDQQSQDVSLGQHFMDGVTSFNRQFGRLFEGTLRTIPIRAFQATIDQVNQYKEAENNAAWDRSPGSAAIGTVLGVIDKNLPLAVATGGRSLLSQVIPSAASNAAMGYLDYSPTQTGRLENAAVNGFVGGAAPLAASIIAPIGRGLLTAAKRTFMPASTAMKDVAATINTEQVGKGAPTLFNDQLAQARANGDERSIGQLMGGRIAEKEGRISTNADDQEAIRAYNLQQQTQALGKLHDTINNMAPADIADQATAAYAPLKTAIVPQDTIDELHSTPVILKAVKDQIADPNLTDDVRNLDPKSMAFYDEVKQRLDHQINWDPKNNSNSYPGNINGLKEARDKIVNALDNKDLGLPDYQTARELAQQNIIKNKYSDLLNTIKAKPRQQGEVGINEIWNKAFSTGDKQDEFVQDVAKTGGNPTNARNMIDSLEQLRSDPVEAITKKPTNVANNPNIWGIKNTFVQKALDSITRGAYKKALLDISLHPSKYAGQLNAALGSSGKGMVSSFLDNTSSYLAPVLNPGSASTNYVNEYFNGDQANATQQ